MSDDGLHLAGVPVLTCPPDGKKLRTERDAVDLIGEAHEQGASLVVIPAERLDDEFFVLRTRIAGEFIQKLVTYRLRLAIVGDIARHLEQSTALRDFVYEANRGTQVWFVPSLADLEEKLRQADPGSG